MKFNLFQATRTGLLVAAAALATGAAMAQDSPGAAKGFDYWGRANGNTNYDNHWRRESFQERAERRRLERERERYERDRFNREGYDRRRHDREPRNDFDVDRRRFGPNGQPIQPYNRPHSDGG